MRILSATFLLGTLPMAHAMIGQAEQGAITGAVTDSLGAVMSGADVTLTEAATQAKRNIRTNVSGSYVFPYLTPAAYQLSVRHRRDRLYNWARGFRLTSNSEQLSDQPKDQYEQKNFLS